MTKAACSASVAAAALALLMMCSVLVGSAAAAADSASATKLAAVPHAADRQQLAQMLASAGGRSDPRVSGCPPSCKPA